VYQRKKLDRLPLLVRKVSYNSQFSVAAYLSCCGIFDGDCYRLIPSLIIKEFWKLVSIWQVTDEYCGITV